MLLHLTAVRTAATSVVLLALLTASCSDAEPASSTPDQGTASSEPAFLKSEEWALRMMDCVRREGFEAELTPDGAGFGVDHSDDQREVVANIVERCEGELVEQGLLPDPNAPMTEATVREMYETAMADHKCLVENELPATQAPSWETYLEGRLSGDEENWWNPFEKVYEAANTGNEQPLLRAFELCETED